MLQRVDSVRLAAIGRARHAWEVRKRLGYPEAKAKLKHVAIVEERVRAGELEPVKRREVRREASPVTAGVIERFQAQHTRAPWRWWRL